MYEIMTADEAIRLIRDGDCICVNSFVGIENPIELHEAIYEGKTEWKMSDYDQYLFLCAEAIYSVPVGRNVHTGRLSCKSAGGQ